MKTFVVIGCHRSATSWVAKGLQETGVHVGDRLMGPGHGNVHGHFEDYDFVELNERILVRAGGTWDWPPYEDAIERVVDVFWDETRELIEWKTFRAKELGVEAWGWKDPRTVVTWPVYRDLLDDPILLVVHRREELVASSLFEREPDTRTYDDCLRIARDYQDREWSVL